VGLGAGQEGGRARKQQPHADGIGEWGQARRLIGLGCVAGRWLAGLRAVQCALKPNTWDMAEGGGGGGEGEKDGKENEVKGARKKGEKDEGREKRTRAALTALCGGTQARRLIGVRHFAGAGAGGGWRVHGCGDRASSGDVATRSDRPDECGPRPAQRSLRSIQR